ncbi:MAG: class I mannose-6-phosphate isomerase, partial [Paludibacteraceae bacterium]|nr:class I mannose-6-phosphate isomerase [Paludibacteraceae bacterium]
MTILYPLLFENNFHDVVWGGTRLKPFKNLPPDDEPVGESWEVSAIPSSASVVRNGPLAGRDLISLTRDYGHLLLGSSVCRKYGSDFPLLVKFIDADKDLSVQVHPDDSLARRRHNCSGKTEMWYVMKAEPGAHIFSGLNQPISKYEYEKRVEDGSICDVLTRLDVHEGDVFYIPAGRIHAICGGVLLAEIQQSSNITYRIFDYNRPGLDGKPRQLHISEAREAIDFSVLDDYRTHYVRQLNKSVVLVDSPYFMVKLLETDRPFHRKLFKYDSFVIYTCIAGDCNISVRSTQGFGRNAVPDPLNASVHLSEGNSCLIPASVADFDVTP